MLCRFTVQRFSCYTVSVCFNLLFFFSLDIEVNTAYYRYGSYLLSGKQQSCSRTCSLISRVCPRKRNASRRQGVVLFMILQVATSWGWGLQGRKKNYFLYHVEAGESRSGCVAVTAVCSTMCRRRF
jgi:hypothetical protein